MFIDIHHVFRTILFVRFASVELCTKETKSYSVINAMFPCIKDATESVTFPKDSGKLFMAIFIFVLLTYTHLQQTFCHYGWNLT